MLSTKYRKTSVEFDDVVRPTKSLPQKTKKYAKKSSASSSSMSQPRMQVVNNDLSDEISELNVGIPTSFKSDTDRGALQLEKQMNRASKEQFSGSISRNSETVLKLAFEPRSGLYLPVAVIGIDINGLHAFVEYIGRNYTRWIKLGWMTDLGNDYDMSLLENFNLPRFRFRKRRSRNTSVILIEDFEDNPFPNVHEKYWSQRYRYFIDFDAGIQLDAESWYSVTPEIIARHTASRCGANIILDAFCGCGGNTIQFAKFSPLVFGIDIDPIKVEMASHNSRIYGVFDKINYLTADSVSVLRQFEGIVDVIVLAPPWGGMTYIDSPTFSLRNLFLGGLSGIDLFNMTKKICPNIVYLLPRNYMESEVDELAEMDDNPSDYFELQDNYLAGKLKMKVLYFGDLFRE